MQLARQMLKFWRKLLTVSHQYLSTESMVSHLGRLCSSYVRDLKFSQQFWWGLKSSGMWCCVTGWVVPDVSKDSVTFLCRAQAVVSCLIYEDNALLLLMTNLTHFFISLFITPLCTFQASQCSSSGDRIVLIRHLVWLVCVSDCLVCRSGGKCGSLLTSTPSSYWHRLIIPDDVLIQFDLLMMSTVMLKMCREV